MDSQIHVKNRFELTIWLMKPGGSNPHIQEHSNSPYPNLN